MTDISKKIREARPNLSVVSPLVWSICWGYVVVNVFIAHSLWVGTTSFILDRRIWAVVFLLLGAGLARSLVRNDWKAIKRFLTAGLFIKSTWTIYLVLITIQYPSTSGILGLWLFMSFVQAMTIIHFVPNGANGGTSD